MKNFRAGTWHKELGYKSFHPLTIDRPWTIDEEATESSRIEEILRTIRIGGV